jgi:hypothetical protein
MLNQNQVIYLDYTNESETSAYVYVPFEVSIIKVKAISSVSSTDDCCVVFSNLVDNQPLGLIHQAGTTDIESQSPELEYYFKSPKSINGNYSFILKTYLNTEQIKDFYVVIFIEFIH